MDTAQIVATKQLRKMLSRDTVSNECCEKTAQMLVKSMDILFQNLPADVLKGYSAEEVRASFDRALVSSRCERELQQQS